MKLDNPVLFTKGLVYALIVVLVLHAASIVTLWLGVTENKEKLFFHDSILTYENIGKFEDVQKRLEAIEGMHR